MSTPGVNTSSKTEGTLSSAAAGPGGRYYSASVNDTDVTGSIYRDPKVGDPGLKVDGPSRTGGKLGNLTKKVSQGALNSDTHRINGREGKLRVVNERR
jgi:hypothetical protein